MFNGIETNTNCHVMYTMALIDENLKFNMYPLYLSNKKYSKNFRFKFHEEEFELKKLSHDNHDFAKKIYDSFCSCDFYTADFISHYKKRLDELL